MVLFMHVASLHRDEKIVFIASAGRDGASGRVWVGMGMVRDVLTKPRSGGFYVFCVFLVVTCAAAAALQHRRRRLLFRRL